ncbi:hypothetical protein AAY473_012516 [Plecturocebus cupreus]
MLTYAKLVPSKYPHYTDEETEAGESLEPRKRTLQRAEILPLHSSLGNRTRLCLISLCHPGCSAEPGSQLTTTSAFQHFFFPVSLSLLYIVIFLKYTSVRPGMVAHTCNPSTLGGQGRQITRDIPILKCSVHTLTIPVQQSWEATITAIKAQQQALNSSAGDVLQNQHALDVLTADAGGTCAYPEGLNRMRVKA